MKVIIFFTLIVFCIADESVVKEDPFSWDKVYLNIETSDYQTFKLWLQNDNTTGQTVKYKTAIKVEKKIIKNGKKSRALKLPAKQEVFVGTYRLNSQICGRVYGYIRINNKVIIKSEELNTMSVPWNDEQYKQNSREAKRIWERRKKNRRNIPKQR
ncbi:hypothetical protein [Candidatus Uabimicrobium sp. HlEnr_7]|uniref:hypothetical protein n=1 Tax=Candidatus Uabimicrobium helgolandensis TaxID=3095367 RepID=UPI0035591FB1